jgi:uncharacterized protein with PQ loop repeat
MKWLLAREVVVGLAVLGGVFSVLASVLQSKGRIGEETANRVNMVGYLFMGISIALFIIAGLLAPAS